MAEKKKKSGVSFLLVFAIIFGIYILIRTVAGM